MLLALLVAPALAGFTLAGKPRVVFRAEGNPGALDIEGKTAALTLAETADSLVFTVDMTTVTTGIELRDHHMKDKYLHVAQFPTVQLAVPRSGVAWPAAGDDAKGTTTCSFTAHGVAQDVTVTWSVDHDAKGYKVRGSFPFDVTRHGIEIPGYLGVTVESAMTAEAWFRLIE